MIFKPSVTRIPRGFEKKINRKCVGVTITLGTRQCSQTKESCSRTLLYRRRSVKMHWNKRQSPVILLFFSAITIIILIKWEQDQFAEKQ